MSGDRRLEFDKGPSLEDEEQDATEPTDADDEDAGQANPGDRGGRVVIDEAPWKAGVFSGVSAFAVTFLILYQLVESLFAAGTFTQVENEPGQWVIAGFTMLGSHGATLEEGGEPMQGAFAYVGSLVSHVSALVPIVVLVVAGYLLVRYVRLETVTAAGQAVGTMVVSYVVLTVVLGLFATWSPEETDTGPTGTGNEPETLAVAVDGSVLFSTTSSALLFVTLGGAIAALPRLLEFAPIATTDAESTS